MLCNAQEMADVFRECGTENHLILIGLRNTDWTGKALEEALDSVGITVNKNMVPFDPRKASETSGIRIGTPAITTLGVNVGMSNAVARAIALIITRGLTEATREYALGVVDDFRGMHKI